MGACVLSMSPVSAYAVVVSGQGTWESTLLGRDLDGDASTFEAYYDTTLDITWLADANAARTSGLPYGGSLTWAEANTWVTSLDVNGVTGWRLPTNTPINGSTYIMAASNNATTDTGFAGNAGWVDSTGKPVSELGHMFYVTLGNLGNCAPDDSTSCVKQTGLDNSGPFSNIVRDYWSGSELDSSSVWYFDFVNGYQSGAANDFSFDAWAVRSGDISAVPVPATALLFGSGLLGLLGIARRKR